MGKARPDTSGADASARVFVGNLNFRIQDDDIKTFFKDCGSITEINWLNHADTGRFKGCGFIQFEDVDQAKKAVTLNGQDLMERPIKVEYSQSNGREKKPAAGRFAGKP